MKCLWRVIKAMPKWLEEEGDMAINLDELFHEVDKFFKEFPSEFWRNRDEDTPFRYNHPSFYRNILNLKY